MIVGEERKNEWNFCHIGKFPYLCHQILLDALFLECLMARAAFGLQDIFRKRVRFISCLRNWTLLIWKGILCTPHRRPCIKGKDVTALLRWYHVNDYWVILHIHRRCELSSILLYTGQSSTFKQRMGTSGSHLSFYVHSVHSKTLFPTRYRRASDATKSRT